MSKPITEVTVITCTCGKQIVFGTRKGNTKPKYVTCHNCKKKHLI
jgi:hypothetical protein